MDIATARRVLKQLKQIFWGALIVLFDFKFTSTSQMLSGSGTTVHRGFSIDLINDTVGYLLITAAANSLSYLSIAEAYRGLMNFAKVAALITALSSLGTFIVYDWPLPIRILGGTITFAFSVGAICFCIAMEILCSNAMFTPVEQSYRTSRWMVIVSVAVVIIATLVHLATAENFVANSPFQPALAVLAGLAIIVAIIHLFVSNHRLKQAIGRWCSRSKCPNCSYALFGTPGWCPECGWRDPDPQPAAVQNVDALFSNIKPE